MINCFMCSGGGLGALVGGPLTALGGCGLAAGIVYSRDARRNQKDFRGCLGECEVALLCTGKSSEVKC